MDTLNLYLALTVGMSSTSGPTPPVPEFTPNCMPTCGAILDPAKAHVPYGRAALGLTKGRWDLEVGFGYLGHSQERTENNGIGYNITASELDLRLRYWLPITDKLKLYGEAGPALVDWHAEQWRFLPRGQTIQCQCFSNGWPGSWWPESGHAISPQAGLGAGYELNKNWMLTAGATRTWGFDGYSTTQLGVGMRYNF